MTDSIGTSAATMADGIWPWLALVVLGTGALFTLLSGLAPLRGLGSALRSLTAAGRDRVRSDDHDRALAVPVAAAAGMGGITGATLAVTLGGPGALPWMWIAALLGMGLAFAEGALGSRKPNEAIGLHLPTDGAIGRLVTPVYALGILALAVLGGAMLQTHQVAAVLGEAMWVPPASASVVMAMVAIVFMFSAGARRILFRVVPAILLLFCLAAAIIAFADGMYVQMRVGDAFNAAFGSSAAVGGAAGGGVAVAIHHGVLRATLAGEAGLGTAGLAGLRSARPGWAGALTMLVPPLVAGLVGTLTALVLLTGTGPEAVVGAWMEQAETERAEPDAEGAEPEQSPAHFAPLVADPETLPLERAFSRGLRPSQQVGQTIVMPEDTTMEAGEHYGVVLRSSGRGHVMAKLDRERNAAVLPAWQVAEGADAIILRAAQADRNAQAAWDIRIPCDREVRAPEGGTVEFLKLTPKDPEIDLDKLVTRLQLEPKAYIPLDDYHFVGKLGRATTGDLGSHVAMYEPEREDRPFNPKLHEFYRNGYRGPYADDGSEPPPFAYVADPDYQPEVGSIVRLTLQAHPRGEPMLHVTRGGNLEAPAWSFLMRSREVVLRHDSDPSRDVRIPVTPRYEEFRIHFDLADPNAQDFARIPEGWHGPFLIVDDFEFEAEVRSDTRLPEGMKGRRALIPVHPQTEPGTTLGEHWPYEPHPADVLALGMHGPVLAVDGAARVAMRFSGQLGSFGTMTIVMCCVILGLSTLVAWSELATRMAAALGGASLSRVVPVILLGAAAAGSWVSLTSLVALTDLAIAVVVLANIVGLLSAIPKIVAAGRDLSRGPQ